jgi:hypothetical protein
MKFQKVRVKGSDMIRLGINGDGSGYLLNIISSEKHRVRNSGMHQVIDTGDLMAWPVAPVWMRPVMRTGYFSVVLSGAELARRYDAWCAAQDEDADAAAAQVADLRAALV